MYFLAGAPAHVRNVGLLASAAGATSGAGSLDGLRQRYHVVVRRQHALVPPSDSARGLHVLADATEQALVRQQFAVEGEPVPVSEARALGGQVLEHIRSADEALAALLLLTLTGVVVDRSSSPGSTSGSALLGVVWLAPTPRWTVATMAEALIHEFTHTAQTIDQRCRTHFLPAGLAPDVVAQSAIRQAARPLPAVVASILVAYEIVAWRAVVGEPELEQAALLHGPTGSLVASCLAALASVWALPRPELLMTDAVRQMLEHIEHELAARETSL